MAVPDRLVSAPGLTTETRLVIVQVNVVEAVNPALSVTVRVTEQAQAAVGVPVIAPVVVLTERPVGSPVADQVRTAVDEESVLTGVRAVIADPETELLLPGLVRVTTFDTVQVKVAVPAKDAVSVAVRVTEHTHPVVGVPVMAPVVLLMLSPAGRPEAAQVSVCPA
jgi:hypothetical protein